MTSRVCVIGAGMSGIVAAKHLREEGVSFDWFEKSGEIGGVWRYRDDPEVFSIYDCCRTIGCKHTMSFRDFPVPDEMEEYPTHRDYFAYLRDYAEHFELLGDVTLGTEVTSVERESETSWRVVLAGGEIRSYDHVVVTTGQFEHPFTPDYEGHFSGTAIHSAHYRTAEPFQEKRVLVVGMGNSGVDIACDVARVAETAWLSTRTSAHIIPKFILGRPFLHFHSAFDDYLPFRVNQLLTKLLAWLGRGRLSSYSFPVPTHDILLKNPTLSDSILEAVRDGRVVVKPAITALEANAVRFEDGSREPVDAIVYATGYTTRFPFLDPELVSFSRGQFENYLHVASIDHRNLYFIGIVDPFGTYPAIVELQARLVVALIRGRCALPPVPRMRAETERHRRKMRAMLRDSSEKPMIREKFYRYQHRLKRFLKRRGVPV